MSASVGIKKILVYGGSGALGNTLVGYFKNKNYVSDIYLVYTKFYQRFFKIVVWSSEDL